MVSVNTARRRPQQQGGPSLLLVIGVASLVVFYAGYLQRNNVDSGLLSLLLGTEHHAESSSSFPSRPPSQHVGGNYDLARHESLGFFQDVNEKDWLFRKKMTQKAKHHVAGADPRKQMKDAASWYANNWDPDFACMNEVAVGGIGEGHKYVCDPNRLPQDCLVYSFGSNGNFRFEQGMNDVAPHCELHTFDPDDYSANLRRSGVRNAHYHAWGLKPSYKSNDTAVMENYGKRFSKNLAHLNFKTLHETIKALGHEGRKIDLFKIDCEGCEWRTYKDWIADSVDIRQIFIEVHNHPLIANDAFQDIHNKGFVIFHKEPNIQWGGGNCVEFSFIKMHADFFGDTH